jgi:CcmD family protein
MPFTLPLKTKLPKTLLAAGRRLKTLVACLLLTAATMFAAPAYVAAQAPQTEQQDEFRPLSELPPQDQLPAAPLLVSAYAVVLLALFFYVLSVARRLNTVQREVQRLESDIKRGGRG